MKTARTPRALACSRYTHMSHPVQGLHTVCKLSRLPVMTVRWLQLLHAMWVQQAADGGMIVQLCIVKHTARGADESMRLITLGWWGRPLHVDV